jgi:hypothetical protein
MLDDAATQTQAVQLIAALGVRAAELAERLPPLFDGSPGLATHAAIAHFHVTRDPEQVLSRLVANVTCTPLGMDVVRCLGEIGPAARDAVPALREAAGSPWRQVVSGSTSDWIATDEAWADLCANTLARIV